MSTIETILSRAMSDANFAELLLAQPEKALASYSLSEEELALFKGLTRAQFEEMAAEDRKSFSNFQLGYSVPDAPEKINLGSLATTKLQDFH